MRSFSTAEDYGQRQCCLKKGTKKKASKTELKEKMTIFTRKTMNYRERGKADFIEFILPHLIVGEFSWISNSSKTHSLELANRGDWTFKKML